MELELGEAVYNVYVGAVEGARFRLKGKPKIFSQLQLKIGEPPKWVSLF